MFRNSEKDCFLTLVPYRNAKESEIKTKSLNSSKAKNFICCETIKTHRCCFHHSNFPPLPFLTSAVSLSLAQLPTHQVAPETYPPNKRSTHIWRLASVNLASWQEGRDEQSQQRRKATAFNHHVWHQNSNGHHALVQMQQGEILTHSLSKNGYISHCGGGVDD